MKLLDMIIKEYISIVEALVQDKPVENNRIIIEREEFKRMLEQYGYISFSAKTKAYKALNLIIHNQNNYTMSYKDTELKKTVRKVIINYKTYETAKHLYETTLNI
jgi:tRNA-dihydrouridine synthase